MNNVTEQRKESGFSLVEVIMASLILMIGITMISSVVANLTEKNFFSTRQTQAVLLAQNKIEELMNYGYESDNLDEGDYENAKNPVTSTGDSGGVFYQFWSVYDLRPIPRSKQIVTKVQWVDDKGDTKNVTLTATCIDESN
jgi:Tfp pilus assembly protein PilV